MKLSFSTLPCLDYTTEQLKELCTRHGIDGVEVRMHSDGSFQCGDGLCVTDVGSSICIRDYDEQMLHGAIQILKKASEQNIKGVRVFLGNFCKQYSASRKPVNHAGIVRMLQEMCDSTDIEVWVETHNEYATGKILQKLLQDVNRSNLKIIWDIIHPIEDGESPKETMAYIGNYIAHIHIKDGRKHEDPDWHDYKYTPLGEGELPILEAVNLLEQSGYQGYYSLEWESAWRPELQELDWAVDDILEKFVSFMKKIENEIRDV